jgi:UDP-N-acetylmuramoyl-tripeptide--D-alanyl-D-alanine ligase
MRGMTVSSAAKACRGAYHGPEELAAREISFITTDSREAKEGCLFIAIKGERSDGHDYMPQAVSKGALCCLAEREPEAENVPYILVGSTAAAIRELAAFYRSQFDIPFIGVTGSVGKTTAKDMISSVLSSRLNVLKTQGNFNNELGVPLTVFRLNAEHEAAVIEMGISDFGEMKRLGAIVRPDYAVFSTIGYSHLEFLGSREGVLRAKSEMLEFMPRGGTVFINGDDDMLISLKCRQKTVSFGLGENCDVRAENISCEGFGGTSCDIVANYRRIHVRIGAYGHHMVMAALAAAAVGMGLGLGDGEIRRGIEAYEPAEGRSHIISCERCTVVDDCYNANPTSVGSSLASLGDIKTRRVCILGDMLELGKDSASLHRKVGNIAAQSGIDAVICCGERARDIYEGAAEQGSGQEIIYFDNKEKLIGELRNLIRSGDTVLVKASRGMRFEEIVKALTSI